MMVIAVKNVRRMDLDLPSFLSIHLQRVLISLHRSSILTDGNISPVLMRELLADCPALILLHTSV